MKKKMLIIFLLLVIAVGMTACGNSSKKFTFDGEWNATTYGYNDKDEGVETLYIDETNHTIVPNKESTDKYNYVYDSEKQTFEVKELYPKLYAVEISTDANSVTLTLLQVGQATIDGENDLRFKSMVLERPN